MTAFRPVIAISSTFRRRAARPRRGWGLDQSTLIVAILMIQFNGVRGALLWGRLAGWVGAKRSIIISLVIWAGVTIFAYFGLKGSDTTGGGILCYGAFNRRGTWGFSGHRRSLYAQIIPTGKQAEYYSFYEVSDKGTFLVRSIAVRPGEPAHRQPASAILSLIFFFIVGLCILHLSM